VERHSFVGTRKLPKESWHQALIRTVENELKLSKDKFKASLTSSSTREQECRHIIEEEMSSPSYPGVHSYYKTHMVNWEVRDDKVDSFRKCGLPLQIEKRDPNLMMSDFITKVRTGIGQKTLFWRWVPAMRRRCC